jgi:hypothetical protein
MKNCAKCLGLIIEPSTSYAYAGKVCQCNLTTQQHDEQIEREVAIPNQEMDTLHWLKTKHPEVFLEQKHLDEGTPERAYWHYGRWSALKDVSARARVVANTAMNEEQVVLLFCENSYISFEDAKELAGYLFSQGYRIVKENGNV